MKIIRTVTCTVHIEQIYLFIIQSATCFGQHGHHQAIYKNKKENIHSYMGLRSQKKLNSGRRKGTLTNRLQNMCTDMCTLFVYSRCSSKVWLLLCARSLFSCTSDMWLVHWFCNVLYRRPINNKYRALVEWYWQEKTEALGQTPVPVLLNPPQTSHGLSWYTT